LKIGGKEFRHTIMSRIALPGYLFDTYALYKKSTASVIQWLSLHSGKGGSRAHLNSTRELIYLTEVVVKEKIRVPNHLLHTIRRAIRARTRVGQFFKNLAASNDNGATASHEYFTSVLQQVHNDLRGLAEAVRETPSTSELKPFERDNAFENLHIEDCSESEDQTPCTVCENRPRVVSRKRRSKNAKDVRKDYVNEFMVLLTYLLVCKMMPLGKEFEALPNQIYVGIGSISCGDQTELEKRDSGFNSTCRSSFDC
jgi:hypothetical protein